MRGKWTRSSAVVSALEGGGAVVEADAAVVDARLFSIGAVGSVMASPRGLRWKKVDRYVDREFRYILERSLGQCRK
jgi:hypothetical protein